MPPFAEAVVQVESSPDTATLAQIVRDQILQTSRRVPDLSVRVTIGAAALRDALEKDDTGPIIAAFVSTTEFRTALDGHPRSRNATAVFSNPDPLDQLTLAKAILSGARLAVFDSHAVHPLIPQLTERGVTAVPVAPGEEIDAVLRAADPFDAIIALPDPAVLNGTNIGHVVRTLYQQRKVLIGYSNTLTQVGSLASVYPTPEGIGRAVRELLERYVAGGDMPAPVFASEVQVSVNERLARSLNIVLPEKGDLTILVRTAHGERP